MSRRQIFTACLLPAICFSWPSSTVIRPLLLDPLPASCFPNRNQCACNVEYVAALEHMKPLSPPINISHFLSGLGIDNELPVGRCIEKSLTRFLSGVHISGSNLRALVAINRLSWNGQGPTTMKDGGFARAVEAHLSRRDQSKHCNLHKWYFVVFQSSFGKTLEETKLNPIKQKKGLLYAPNKEHFQQLVNLEIEHIQHSEPPSISGRKHSRETNDSPGSMEGEAGFATLVGLEELDTGDTTPESWGDEWLESETFVGNHENVDAVPILIPRAETLVEKQMYILQLIQLNVNLQGYLRWEDSWRSDLVLQNVHDRLFVPASVFSTFLAILPTSERTILQILDDLDISQNHQNWYVEHFLGVDLDKQHLFRAVLVETSAGVRENMVTLPRDSMEEWMKCFCAKLVQVNALISGESFVNVDEHFISPVPVKSILHLSNTLFKEGIPYSVWTRLDSLLEALSKGDTSLLHMDADTLVGKLCPETMCNPRLRKQVGQIYTKTLDQFVVDRKMFANLVRFNSLAEESPFFFKMFVSKMLTLQESVHPVFCSPDGLERWYNAFVSICGTNKIEDLKLEETPNGLLIPPPDVVRAIALKLLKELFSVTPPV